MTRTFTIALAAMTIIACSKGTDRSESSQGKSFTPIAEPPRVAPSPRAMAEDVGLAAHLQSQNGSADEIAQTAGKSTASGNAPLADGVAPETSPSMIIRTGNASIEIESIDPAVAKLRQLASQLGGYVANSSFTGGREQVRTAMLELKIPAAKYDQAVNGLNGIGKLESINTSAVDVGEEYVDVAAREANAKRLEQRLVSLLATRTGKLEDVLAVERELARVREEIERYDGRMRVLKTRTSVSTLSVTMHEPYPILGHTPGENPLAAALRHAWRNFVGFIAAVIASLGVLIPVAVLIAIGSGVYRKVLRRRSTS